MSGTYTLEIVGIALLVGSVIGWLAAKIAHGTTFGLVADIAIGIAGALIGALILDTGSGHVDDFAGALIGAVVLLAVVRFAAPKLR